MIKVVFAFDFADVALPLAARLVSYECMHRHEHHGVEITVIMLHIAIVK